MIVHSKVKDLVKGADMRTGESFLIELEVEIGQLVKDAIARAKANNRSTLQGHDL